MIKNIVIVGTGALATFYANKWKADFKVSVLGSWQESIDALNNQELIFATSKWNEVTEPDLVIWLTKTYRNESALNKYVNLHWNCPILILQNGIGQKEYFKCVLGDHQELIRGVSTQGAKLNQPGIAINTGDGDINTEQNELLDDFPVVQSSTFKNELLKKLAINAVINPIAALNEVKNGDAVCPALLGQAKDLVSTCFTYFQNRGVFKSEDEYLNIVIKAAENTAENTNSMLSDKLSGRSTEIKEILGPIQEEVKSKVLEDIITSLTLP